MLGKQDLAGADTPAVTTNSMGMDFDSNEKLVSKSGTNADFARPSKYIIFKCSIHKSLFLFQIIFIKLK